MAHGVLTTISTDVRPMQITAKCQITCGAMWRKTFFLKSRGQELKSLVNDCIDKGYIVQQHLWTAVDKVERQNAVTEVKSDIYESYSRMLVPPMLRNLSNEKNH